jgi:hypothetical protein
VVVQLVERVIHSVMRALVELLLLDFEVKIKGCWGQGDGIGVKVVICLLEWGEWPGREVIDCLFSFGARFNRAVQNPYHILLSNNGLWEKIKYLSSFSDKISHILILLILSK